VERRRARSGFEAAATAAAVVVERYRDPVGASARALRGAGCLAARAASALGTQRPSAPSCCPAAQAMPQAFWRCPCTRLSRMWSGSSIGSLALTRSVKSRMARREEVVHAPLISPS
jgi:hypothetical protein